MSLETNDNMVKSAQTALPVAREVHKKSSRLSLFNTIALGVPALTLALPLLSNNKISYSESLLAAGFLTAATVQYSRWQKAKIRDLINTLWDKLPEETRQISCGFMKETVDSKIGKSDLAVSTEDFGLHKHKLIPLASSAVAGYFAPAVAPVAFFAGSQSREWADSARLEVASRHTIDLLVSIQRNFS